jgi:hypothetical protein
MLQELLPFSTHWKKTMSNKVVSGVLKYALDSFWFLLIEYALDSFWFLLIGEEIKFPLLLHFPPSKRHQPPSPKSEKNTDFQSERGITMPKIIEP